MPRGGKRLGAGRPKGKGKYSTATKPIRVPENMIEKIEQLIQENFYELPIYSNYISAGFPSPADDHKEGKLDLNNYLINKPAATFLVKVSGDSMIDVGINPGDLLVVDRSIEPRHNKIVIAAVNSELTVKRLYKKDGVVKLIAENQNYPDIVFGDESTLIIWGVVTSVIHKF